MFLNNRLSRLLADQGMSKDIVAAVISASADRIPDVERRADALEALKGKADFDPLAAAFKRVENILKKAAETTTVPVNPALFAHTSEGALHAASQGVTAQVGPSDGAGGPGGRLGAIATLRDPVDAFFNDVMVMADDDAVRRNRWPCWPPFRPFSARLPIFHRYPHNDPENPDQIEEMGDCGLRNRYKRTRSLHS
jgi:glycyl-tRNA synthetase beta chain